MTDYSTYLIPEWLRRHGVKLKQIGWRNDGDSVFNDAEVTRVRKSDEAPEPRIPQGTIGTRLVPSIWSRDVFTEANSSLAIMTNSTTWRSILVSEHSETITSQRSRLELIRQSFLNSPTSRCSYLAVCCSSEQTFCRNTAFF